MAVVGQTSMLFVKSLLRKYLLPYLTLLLLRILWITWKIQLSEPESMRMRLANKKPFLLAHWHGDEVVLLPLVSRYHLATLTSTSKDGELMTWLVAKLGGISARGSSTRGGVGGLKGLIRLVKSGAQNASVAVDGPKGPIYKVKPGIFELSRLTGTPIYWVGVSADRYFLFSKAWNKAILPKPFARVVIHWHGPMEPIASTEDPKSERLKEALENHLVAAKQHATQLLVTSLIV